MTPEQRKSYEVDPDPCFQYWHLQGYDGYDIMEKAEQRGWHVIPGWGKDGYNLGDWPYVVVYTKVVGTTHYVAIYCEGDMTQYALPDRKTRHALIDDTAFFYWKHQSREWVKDYNSVDELPPELRGPYRD